MIMHKELYGQIRGVKGFDVPSDYQTLYEAGLVAPGHPNRLVMSDTRWLSLVEIAQYRAPSHRRASLIPFAFSGRRDSWAWDSERRGDSSPPVFFCPVDLNRGTLYAPTFLGCVYRLLLEECSSTWLITSLGSLDQAIESLRKSVLGLAPFLPKDWSDKANDIIARPLVAAGDGTHYFITPEEAHEAIYQSLRTVELDQSIVIEKE
jgi:hypothetical protein